MPTLSILHLFPGNNGLGSTVVLNFLIDNDYEILHGLRGSPFMSRTTFSFQDHRVESHLPVKLSLSGVFPFSGPMAMAATDARCVQ